MSGNYWRRKQISSREFAAVEVHGIKARPLVFFSESVLRHIELTCCVSCGMIFIPRHQSRFVIKR